MPTFTYTDGKVTDDAGWFYDIKERFNSQLQLQPQYRGLVEIDAVSGVPFGAYCVANMATGLADQDYRDAQGILPTVLGQLPQPSAFADWLQEGNRQRICQEAAGWFTA